MKIKLDFVTNSSSSSYVLGVKPSIYDDIMEHINRYPQDAYLDYEFTNLKELQDFTNGRPYDWASKPRGLYFVNLTEYQYKQLKKIIESGKIALVLRCDHYMEESFYETKMFSESDFEFFDD